MYPVREKTLFYNWLFIVTEENKQKKFNIFFLNLISF